ncbi:MAG: methylmalonyl-CoA mutase family protein, partial [Bryobacterales bacterium]|nr:methylmalonyl-CoA mutase family protein [Bryobacterales bacterium]
LRTQQVIALESGVDRAVDPLGGSYCIEGLTDRIEEEALAYIARIDDQGGMVAAIENGYVQREIHDSAYALQQKVERGEQTVVGVNAFRSNEPADVPLLKIDHSQEAERRGELARFRSERDAGGAAVALDRLRDGAAGSGNLVPAIRTAVAAAATLGEISDALRDVFGSHE